MVGPKLYHLKHTRSFQGFKDPTSVLSALNSWLHSHDFHTRVKNAHYAKGSKRGIHVNHIPKFKLHVHPASNGVYVVTFDYYCKVKLGSAIVVGILTSGISTAVGVGTLAIQLVEGDHFVDKFWKYADTLALTPAVIVSVERWASDGKGNMVLQPAVVATQPVVAVQQPAVVVAQPAQPVYYAAPAQTAQVRPAQAYPAQPQAYYPAQPGYPGQPQAYPAQAQAQVYSPQQPAYSPQQPAYSPQQPAYSPQQPAYSPQSPYSPQQQHSPAAYSPQYQSPAYYPADGANPYSPPQPKNASPAPSLYPQPGYPSPQQGSTAYAQPGSGYPPPHPGYAPQQGQPGYAPQSGYPSPYPPPAAYPR